MAMIDVEVTEDDIRDGRCQGVDDCPIALAFCRAANPNAYWLAVDVDKEGIYLWGLRNLRRATPPLPAIARDFIADFDAKRSVKPIKFRVRLLTWAVRAYLQSD